jgi:calpain-15
MSQQDSNNNSIIKSFSSQASSKGFSDELFTPNFDSLFSSKKEILNYESPTIPKFLKDKKKLLLSQFALSQKDGRYSWAKLSEIKDTSKLKVITPNAKNLSEDVIQGELGDCYFLSTLSALAENPKNITNIVHDTKVSDGNFEATIYIHGEPVKVVIDDSFPVANATKIAFAGINEKTGNIWPMILEKIWAKCNKSYEDIIPGNSSDAFEFLTPAPFDHYFHTQEISNSLFKIIQDASDKNQIILADITETKNTNLDTLSKMGLITNHAYSIIGTAVLKKPNGNEIQLIKMKNIWGTNEWIGDWSDKSLKWTQEFKKAVGLQEKEDGVFWMSYDDYLQFYTTTHIAQIHSDYNYNVIKMKNKEAQNICKINIEKKGSGYFMLNLKNTRIYHNLKNPNYSNPYCSVFVIKKIDENNYELIGSDSGKKDRFYIPCENMEKGVYYISVSFPKNNNKNNILQENYEYNQTEFSFRIGVYSSIKDIKFTPIEDK